MPIERSSPFSAIHRCYSCLQCEHISKRSFGRIIADNGNFCSKFDTFRRSFGPEWYLANKVGFDQQGAKILQKSVSKYKMVAKYDTPKKLSEKIVSEMTLGFWSNLFHRKYEDPLWRKHLRHAFPHVGGPLTRGQIFIMIDNMRRLRNRISHHEQIIKYDLDKYYNNIIDLVSWVSPVMAIWLSHHNRFYDVKEHYREELSLILP